MRDDEATTVVCCDVLYDGKVTMWLYAGSVICDEEVTIVVCCECPVTS